MTGVVTPNREAVVLVQVRGPRGQEVQVDAGVWPQHVVFHKGRYTTWLRR